MLIELTSCDIKQELAPFQDVFESSSIRKTSTSGIFSNLLLVSREKPFERRSFTPQNLLPILQIDYSSSLYGFFESKNETALTEEFFRKMEKIKVLENVSGMLNELTAEQMEIFEVVVKRRPFFK